MSTLQIKPRNDTDQLKIQTSGGNTAFFVHGSGATLKNSTIENTNTFPAGHIIQTRYTIRTMASSTQQTLTTTYAVVDLAGKLEYTGFSSIKSSGLLIIEAGGFQGRSSDDNTARTEIAMFLGGTNIGAVNFFADTSRRLLIMHKVLYPFTTAISNKTIDIRARNEAGATQYVSAQGNTDHSGQGDTKPYILIQEVAG